MLILLGALASAAAPGAPAAADPPAADLEGQIRSASRQLETVIEEYHSLREDLRVTLAQADVLSRQMVPLERHVDDIRLRLGLVAATAYRTARLTDVNVLLAGADRDTLVRRLDALDMLARQRHREIAELGDTRERYLVARRTLEALAQQERTQQHELVTRRSAIEAQLAHLRDLRRRAYGPDERGSHPTVVRGRALPPVPPGVAGQVVRYALAQLGKRYLWAGEGPDGFDCSGLVLAAWKAVGVVLPHSSSRQFSAVTRVTRAELRPGDLVFYYRDVHHVGIYLGDGLLVHAPEPGETVRVDALDHAPIQGYGRPASA